MIIPESKLQSSCKKLLDQEKSLFQKAYKKHYVPGETKGVDIGAPFLLHQPESTRAVLLIHGFMAAPYEVREWADDLFSKGYSVYAPRLAGHGTSAVDLANQSYENWIDSVEKGYKILARCSEQIIVAGFSTGAGLALYQAIQHPNRYQAVISVSAPMKFQGLSSTISETIELWNQVAKRLKLKGLQKNYAVNHPDNPEINYHRCPIHGFNQVKALMRKVYMGLSELSIPVLVVQGNRDPKVSPTSGKKIFTRIRAHEKKYVEIDYHLHGIVRGSVGVSVFSAAASFLSKHRNRI
jgi:carboxylesterase